MSLTTDDFTQIRTIIREEVDNVFDTRGRSIIREEVEAVVNPKFEPLTNEIKALRNDIKEFTT